MANFNGKLTIEVTFENLNVPVGFGMTDAIIYHNCAEQIYLRSPWTKLDKKGIKANFKIEKTRNKEMIKSDLLNQYITKDQAKKYYGYKK